MGGSRSPEVCGNKDEVNAGDPRTARRPVIFKSLIGPIIELSREAGASKRDFKQSDATLYHWALENDRRLGPGRCSRKWSKKPAVVQRR